MGIKTSEFLKTSLRQFSLRTILPQCTALLELPSSMLNLILRGETQWEKRQRHHLLLSKIKIKTVRVNWEVIKNNIRRKQHSWISKTIYSREPYRKILTPTIFFPMWHLFLQIKLIKWVQRLLVLMKRSGQEASHQV